MFFFHISTFHLIVTPLFLSTSIKTFLLKKKNQFLHILSRKIKKKSKQTNMPIGSICMQRFTVKAAWSFPDGRRSKILSSNWQKKNNIENSSFIIELKVVARGGVFLRKLRWESWMNKNKVKTVSLFEFTTDNKININDAWFFFFFSGAVNVLELYGSLI